MMTLNEMGSHAREAPRILGILGSRGKNMGLEEAAKALLEDEGEILEVNFRNYEKTRFDGMNQGLLNRLKLTPARVQAMADGLLRVAALEDPMGEALSVKLRPNGLQIGRRRVPLRAAGMIYEAHSNVTADTFDLCFKSGNAVISEGGGDTLHSDMVIIRYLHAGLSGADLPKDSAWLIEDTSRGTTRELTCLNRYVNAPIPKGGAGLIKTVVENSTILVTEADTGSCHVYVDASADQNMALDVISNAKTQRIGVCNVCESLLVHRNIAEESLPLLGKKLEGERMGTRGDEDACAIEPSSTRATEENWGREYLDYILSLKLVDSVDEVIYHIDTYNTGRLETIVTSDYFNAQRFSNEVDAAAVCVDTSAHFTGGEEFGFETEIGISTQKLHARGPMDLKGLTTTKYITYGDGQIR